MQRGELMNLDRELLRKLEQKRQNLFEVRKKGQRKTDRLHVQLTDAIDDTRKRMKGRRKPGK